MWETRDDVSDDDDAIPSFEAEAKVRGKRQFPKDVSSAAEDAGQQHRRSLEGPVDVVGDVVPPSVDTDTISRVVPDHGPIAGRPDDVKQVVAGAPSSDSSLSTRRSPSSRSSRTDAWWVDTGPGWRRHSTGEVDGRWERGGCRGHVEGCFFSMVTSKRQTRSDDDDLSARRTTATAI